MRRLLVGCLLATASAWAEDGGGSGSAQGIDSGSASAVGASAVRSSGESTVGSGSKDAIDIDRIGGQAKHASCSYVRGYFEPSLFLAATTTDAGVLARAALGFQVTDCAASGMAMRLGGGGTASTESLGFVPRSNAGADSIYETVGVEAEIDAPIVGKHLGLRLGYEVNSSHMFTVGARWRTERGALALDAFQYTTWRDDAHGFVYTVSPMGVMAGVSGDVPLEPIRLGIVSGLGLAIVGVWLVTHPTPPP